MDLKPTTEREIYINLNNEIHNLREAIDRFGTQLLNLETKKFDNHEMRISNLEDRETERKGMWKLILAIGIFLSIAVTILTIKTFLTPTKPSIENETKSGSTSNVYWYRNGNIAIFMFNRLCNSANKA